MLITKVFSAIKNNGVINIAIDLEATNYCLVNFDAFANYKKFESLLVERIVERKINYLIVGWKIVKITIVVKDEKEIDLTF